MRPTTMPARNAPRAIETPNSLAEPDGDAQGHDEHREREQLAGARCRRPVEQPGDQRSPGEERQADHHRDLHDGHDHGEGDAPGPDCRGRRRPAAAPARGR